MSNFNKKVLTYIIASFLMLYTFVPYLLQREVVQAAGVRVDKAETLLVPNVTTEFGVPSNVKEKNGGDNRLHSIRSKLFPTASSNQYWGQDLPFTLTGGGKDYAGYCAQSYQYANSSNMSAQGVIADPRIYKLINTVTPDNPSKPDADQQLALQIALWAALNNNWSSDLFKKHVNLHALPASMRKVSGYLQDISEQWGNIIQRPTKHVVPIDVTGVTVKSHVDCKKGNTTKAVKIQWAEIPNRPNIDISKIANIKYSGLPADAKVLQGGEPGVYTQMQSFGLDSNKNSHYIVFDPGNEGGEVTVTAQVEYKGDYAPLNNLTLTLYSGGSGYQPFIMPVPTADRQPIQFKIKWDNCKIIPDCPDGECPKEGSPSCGSSSSKSTELRWFNMPTAFGEIKDGSGYNPNGVTTSGTYAQTRNSEEFEAMNGVPSTERLYVNLGGTLGVIDVKYILEEVEQEFSVDWNTPWQYEYPCGTAEAPATCTKSGSNSFNKKIPWKFKTLHLEEASFRVLGNGSVQQSDLELDLQIVNAEKDKGSYVLEPNKKGLEVGPGTGVDKYNIGATNSWNPCQGVFTTAMVNGRESVESDGKQEAYDKANASVGEIFAQNDKLEITIGGEKYTIVPDVNKKTDIAYKDGGGELDSTNGEKEKYFKPVGEQWDVWSHIGFAGYNGNPEDDGNRSVDGTPLLLENIPLNIHKGNGIYEFQSGEFGNYLDYESLVTEIKGAPQSIQQTVDELNDGKSKGEGTVYKSAKSPTNPDVFTSGNNVLLQYTNWQVPVSQGKKFTFKHSGNEPDMNKDASLADNPTYRSINPILLHNPTSVIYSWISDIPVSQLQDQRIDASNERISKHARSEDEGANPRQYIDYDFQLTIPNTATFNKYWSQTANNSQETGFEDPDFTNPGTLGKLYEGNAVPQVTTRSYESPYLNASGWDVSKWTTAKYVKFPYDVYYYKNSGESGGDQAGFYDAGTWIKLFDDNQQVKSGDPTVFNFHVSSEQKDIKDGIIYVMSEAINSQDGLTGNADALYGAGEQYVNGTRNVSGTNLGTYNTPRDGEATYSTVNQMNIDAIGRIGNLLVSDTSDPAWTDVFWKTKNGKVDVTTPVHKDYGTYFNIYDSIVDPNNTGFHAYNRFHTLDPWHGQMEPLQTIPLTTNQLTKGKEDQVVKLGYSVGGSIQTIGDYDYSMWIYPQNQLAGKFATGNPSSHFKLVTSDPYQPGTKYQEYYDSNVNNTLHGNSGLLGKEYTPIYKHLLSLSLADPRMKMSEWEKKSTTYQKAVQLGSSKKILTGTPSWIVIPQALRTLIGNDESQGRWGVANTNGNNVTGSKDSAGSANCPCSYENAQKWNWNYSLPQNTYIWFDQDPKNTNSIGVPKFEKPSKDQYIITSMTFRTKVQRTSYPGQNDEWQTQVKMPAINYGDNYLVKTPQSVPDWDLTMFTNTGANGLPDLIKSTKYVPDGFTPDPDPSKPKTWDPTQDGDISKPMLDIVWWNYSKQSTTDKDNVGTH